MTWLTLFLHGFNQKSRLKKKKTQKKRKRKKERKKNTKWLPKTCTKHLLMQTRSPSGLICYGKVMTASHNAIDNLNAPFHRK